MGLRDIYRERERERERGGGRDIYILYRERDWRERTGGRERGGEGVYIERKGERERERR